MAYTPNAVVPSLAAFEAATMFELPNSTAYLLGYSTENDGGEGMFVLGAAATADGITIVNDGSGRSWYRQYKGSINIFWAGAKGDACQFTDTVTCSAGSYTVTFAQTTFTAADIGKVIVITGAGTTQMSATAGNELRTTIASANGTTTIQVATAVDTTLPGTSETVTFGTDDTSALQAAITASNGSVYLPEQPMVLRGPSGTNNPGGYMISGNISLANRYGFPICLWNPTFGTMNMGPTLYHWNVGVSLISSTANGGSGLSGIRIFCLNMNAQNPISAPGTVMATNELYLFNVNVFYAFSAFADSTSGGGPIYAEEIGLYNIHSRGFYLNNNGDISYFRKIRGKFWTSACYGYSAAYLFEFATDCQGAVIDQAFVFGAGGLFLLTGSTLQISATNIGAEQCVLPVQISTTGSTAQSFSMANGYLQTNNRADANSVYSNQGAAIVQFTNVSMLNSQNVQLCIFANGSTTIDGGYFAGNSTAFTFSGGSAVIKNTKCQSLAYIFNFVGAATGCYFDSSNECLDNSNTFNTAPQPSDKNYINILQYTMATTVTTPPFNTGEYNGNAAVLELTVQLYMSPTGAEPAVGQIAVSRDGVNYFTQASATWPAGSAPGYQWVNAKIPPFCFYSINQEPNPNNTIQAIQAQLLPSF